jgi:hypothetical protein
MELAEEKGQDERLPSQAWREAEVDDRVVVAAQGCFEVGTD